MNAATKTKRTLLRAECVSPPREIREITKARREWLATKLAEINALPSREAKIVGLGSYQSISVYEIKEIEGRLRLRGACQFCGNSQVVSGGRLVLHGYKRPGDGQVWGECPGMGLAPLNTEKIHTEKWLAEAKKSLEIAGARFTDTLKDQETASAAFHASNEHDTAYKNAPRKRASWLSQTSEEKTAYESAFNQWAVTYPLYAACSKAQRAHEAARQAKWSAEEGLRHFQFLIDSGVHGTELTQEVVA